MLLTCKDLSATCGSSLPWARWLPGLGGSRGPVPPECAWGTQQPREVVEGGPAAVCMSCAGMRFPSLEGKQKAESRALFCSHFLLDLCKGKHFSLDCCVSVSILLPPGSPSRWKNAPSLTVKSCSAMSVEETQRLSCGVGRLAGTPAGRSGGTVLLGPPTSPTPPGPRRTSVPSPAWAAQGECSLLTGRQRCTQING